MKLELTNENYCAEIVKVKNIIKLKNMDNLVSFPIYGYSALIGKDVEEGSMGIIFTAETQLSEEYCKGNNLYSSSYLNSDQNIKGYMGKNRRVRSIKLRGNNSSALFMPLESLKGIKTSKLKEGDKFNSIDGVEFCRKYFIEKIHGNPNKTKGKTKMFQRIDNKTFPEHYSTVNYFRNKTVIGEEDYITVTQKLHGTSGRFGHVLVRRQLGFVENLLKKCGININETSYDYIAGSRRVIKDKKAIIQHSGYYKSDVWNGVLDRYKNLIPKDYILYGEVVGYIGNKEIQKGYSYDLKEGDFELYVYRISIVNQDGIATDLTMKQVQMFCMYNGFKCVPLLWEGKHKDFIVDDYLNITYSEKYKQAIPLSSGSVCDEGVVVRMEHIAPIVLKAKSSNFLEHETKMIDDGVEDTETLESNES